ncbi:hypothetical protein SAV14893_006380 [Streptomyces avermitilis]|uniref:Uncharacterized protein n=1 Tax=Streptomyces avermitilis TaxID=33903 RepID=A0A4D4LJU3_STRAX|nr:hypothetical protein SAV14893_006380 [Streptomyces avermitilis]
MRERHFEHGVLGQREPTGPVARALHDQRQHVERAAGAAGPAEATGERGQTGVARVTGDCAAGAGVAGVPDELLVPDPRSWTAGRVGCEHRDQGADTAVPGGLPQVVRRSLGDVLCVPHVPAVAYAQGVPVQPPYAPIGVPPGDPGAEDQFFRGVSVRPCLRDLRVRGGDAAGRVAEAFFGVVEGEERGGGAEEIVPVVTVLALVPVMAVAFFTPVGPGGPGRPVGGGAAGRVVRMPVRAVTAGARRAPPAGAWEGRPRGSVLGLPRGVLATVRRAPRLRAPAACAGGRAVPIARVPARSTRGTFRRSVGQ